MPPRNALDGNRITLTWPGKPDGTRPAARSVTRLPTRERWPAGAAPENPAPARSTLIEGDALAVLGAWAASDPALPADPVRLIYLDPPFATGTAFAANAPVGERRPGRPTLRLPAYRDVWAGGLPGYLGFMYDLLAGLRAVLADDGWLCLHCDHRASAHLRLLLDELFGSEAFRNEIVWSYGLGNGTSRSGFPRKHDTLLLYAKSDAARFTPVRGAVSPAMANKYRHVRPDGTRFMRSYGREYDLKGGKPIGSVWEIPSVAPTSAERTGYPTQKPLALLKRLIAATTAPGDLILDPCCGSGTTLLAAAQLGRPAVGIDPSPLAIATARSRLVSHGIRLDVVRPPPMGAGGDADRPVGGQPRGGLTVAPARRYRLDAVAVLAPMGSNQDERRLTISLAGLTVSPQPSTGPDSPWNLHDGHLVGATDPAPITETWTDWIEGWAVQLGEGDGERNGLFTVAAATFRTDRRRSLETDLTVPIPVSGTEEPVVVRMYDLFGAASDHVVPVTWS